MNIRPWVFSIVLGAGCTALRAAPQKIASGHAENLENCLEGFASCDYAQLNPQEKQAVRGAARANNFLDCFHGFADCDKKQLTAEQRQEVARARRIQNLESCVDGIGGCDTTLLTEKQGKWRKSPASATSSPAWTEPGFATSHNSPKTRNNKQKKPITTTTSRIAWKVWATATALCSAAKDSKRLPRKRTTGSFASASMVPMPAIPLSLAAPNSATSP